MFGTLGVNKQMNLAFYLFLTGVGEVTEPVARVSGLYGLLPLGLSRASYGLAQSNPVEPMSGTSGACPF